jgi:superfamily I DNA and RNA helicase
MATASGRGAAVAVLAILTEDTMSSAAIITVAAILFAFMARSFRESRASENTISIKEIMHRQTRAGKLSHYEDNRDLSRAEHITSLLC